MTANGRKAPRAATNHLAGIEWRHRAASVRVVDLSMTGARLATHDVFKVGEAVVLTTVRMGRRPGVVIRYGDGELGIRFNDELAQSFEARAAAAPQG